MMEWMQSPDKKHWALIMDDETADKVNALLRLVVLDNHKFDSCFKDDGLLYRGPNKYNLPTVNGQGNLCVLKYEEKKE